MRRVLVPGGRAALSVWTGASPYFMALRDGLARYISSEAAASTEAAFSLPDAAELRGLLEAAGYRDVLVHNIRMTLRLPPLDEFLLPHLSSLPVAGLVATASEESRAALIAHMKENTREYVDGYGLAVPQEVNVATGISIAG